MRRIVLFFVLTLSFWRNEASGQFAIYQWSVEMDNVISNETNEHPRAFLWIPENCAQVKAVVLGQHNMSEENILDHPEFRRKMKALGIALIWVTPGFNMTFDFHNGAGEQFEGMMKALAKKTGYKELEFAPVIPIGHSAYASYPWNFAAWNPERTLAVISVHGDAPLTNLTGSGQPNPDWGKRNIDGVPGLMIMGEYEWWEDRLTPAIEFKNRFPKAPISLLADAGHGHFDVSDELIRYLCLFIQKSVKYRMPKNHPLDDFPELQPVLPKRGWLAERWRMERTSKYKAAKYKGYKGPREDAFWYFDKETAQITEKYYARERGKKYQYLGFEQKERLLPFSENLHAQIVGEFGPENDSLTFHIKPVFTDSLRNYLSDNHAPGKPEINRICGPVNKNNDTTFTVRFYRMGLNNPKRTGDIWLLASHPGNHEYKSAVQQVNIRIPYPLKEGLKQRIHFDSIPDIENGLKLLKLEASSTSEMPVFFYVKEGPAYVDEGKLVFTKIPPKAKYPIKTTVVAWQYGRIDSPKIQTAKPVEQSFLIYKK